MKLAHLAVVTPKRCGLYETTRELVCALRKKGVDSRIVDPTYATNALHPKTDSDRGAPLEGSDAFAKEADILVNHSGLGKDIEELDIPTIQVAHGRPASSFKCEATGSTPIYSYYYRKNSDPRVKALVTFWEQHRAYWSVLFPDTPIYYVPSCVDLKAWSPDGPSGYQFSGKKGKINVVSADPVRIDIDPYESLNAFALWARNQEGAKLHVYGQNYNGKRGWTALLRRIADDGNLGEMKGWVNGLEHVYRAADMVITPHSINTRTVREAMACGCPVVRVRDIHRDGTKLTFAKNASRARIRAEAERQFDPAMTAEAFIRVLDGIERRAA